MFPEETRVHLNELIENHEKITPLVLFEAFKEGLKDKVRCEEEDICVEAAATREYDYYLEKEDKLEMHLCLMRQMVENGHEWQLVLDMEFKMNTYFEKYEESNPSAGAFRSLFFAPRKIWFSQFNGQTRAEKIVQDVFANGSYLSYSVIFGDVQPSEE